MPFCLVGFTVLGFQDPGKSSAPAGQRFHCALAPWKSASALGSNTENAARPPEVAGSRAVPNAG